MTWQPIPTQELTPEAQQVLDEVTSEIQINLAVSDVHSATDIAADIVQRLYRNYRVIPYDDGEPGPLSTTTGLADGHQP